MNGAADMGGMHGFGPVVPEQNEPVFHADWEKSAFALNMVTGVARLWNLDAFRFKRECIPPAQYLNLSYYGLWTVALEQMMLEYGVATPEELAAGHAIAPVKKAARRSPAADMTTMVRCGSPYNRPAPAPARFKVGDKVRAKNMHPKTHTRLPRYARGHAGNRSCASSVATYFPIAMPAMPAKIRTGSTPCASTAANCGALTAIRRCGSASRPGSLIWRNYNCHSGTARSAGPGIQIQAQKSFLDSGFAR